MTITSRAIAGVHTDTPAELVRTLHDLAAGATDPGVSRGERMARFANAGDRYRSALTAVQLLNPYTDPACSRVVDLLNPADTDAPERLQLAAAADQLRALLAYATRATDLSGTIGTGVTDQHPTAAPNAAHWLNTYATPVPVTPGRVDQIPTTWDNIPEATIGSAEPDTASATIDGDPAPFQHAYFVANPSLQVQGWSGTAAREIEALLAMVVDHGLETHLLGQLLTGVPAAADLEAAEVAIGAAWPAGPDLILVNGTDKPAVLRDYATAGIHPQDRPTILATAGVTAGTVVMLATAGIILEATPMSWYAVPDPQHFGTAIGAGRYARVSLRLAGTVQTITLGA